MACQFGRSVPLLTSAMSRLERSNVCSSNMKHVNLATLDGKQHAITTNYHLPNLFRELVIFGREREGPRHNAKLFENRGAHLAGQLLCLAFTPGATTPVIRLTHVFLR